MCGVPPKIENGYHIGSETPVNGSQYDYKCNNGYDFQNDTRNSAICTEHGNYTWKHEFLPICTPIGKTVSSFFLIPYLISKHKVN